MSEPSPKPESQCPFHAPKANIYSGVTGLNVLGSAAKEDLFSMFDEKSYNLLMSKQSLLFRDIFLINNPENFRQLIVDMPDRVPKSEQMRSALKPLIGDSIFIANGDEWKRRRSMVEPAIKMLTPSKTFFHINAAVEDMLDRLKSQIGQPKFDLEMELSHVTADAIFRAIFSDKLDSDIAQDLFSALQNYQRELPHLSIKGMLGLPNWLPGGVSKKGLKHASRIREILSGLIDIRIEKTDSEKEDLLAKMFESKDQNGNGFTKEELIDEIGLLFLAGHETTASVLTWTVFLTKKDGNAFELLNKELTEKIGAEKITHKNLSTLEVARNLFAEGLRLYPPVPFLTRELTEKTPMRMWNMRKKSMVIISPWLIHRHRRFWKNPDEFEAERFAKKNKDQVDKRAYLPFGAGPRVCPGASFALMEGPLVLASIFQRFEIEVESDKSLRPICRLTARPSTPIYIRILSEKIVAQ